MIRSTIRSLLRKLGYDIRRVSTSSKSSFAADAFDAQRLLMESMGITQPTIFDIGAHRAETAKKYRSRFPNALIYCFEPFPDSMRILKERVGEDPRIRPVQRAVSDKPGKRRFHVNELDDTSSLLRRPEGARRYYPRKDSLKSTIEVDVTTIDAFVRQEQIGNIDILKLDIQGGELMALRGAADTLKGETVALVYTECMFVPHYENNPLLYELWAFLAGFGYTIFDIYNLTRATNGQVRYGDALFVSREVRGRVIDKFPDEP